MGKPSDTLTIPIPYKALVVYFILSYLRKTSENYPETGRIYTDGNYLFKDDISHVFIIFRRCFTCLYIISTINVEHDICPDRKSL